MSPHTTQTDRDLSSLGADHEVCPGTVALPAKGSVIQQFIKFCIVGFSSLGLSLGISYGLIGGWHLRQHLHALLSSDPALQARAWDHNWHIQIAAFCGFVVGVTNGFIWNSRWTFPQSNPAQRHTQAVRFLLVNMVGLLLNETILYTMMNYVLPTARADVSVPWQLHVANLVAVFFTAFWNFGANRLWTFKH